MGHLFRVHKRAGKKVTVRPMAKVVQGSPVGHSTWNGVTRIVPGTMHSRAPIPDEARVANPFHARRSHSRAFTRLFLCSLWIFEGCR
jgi:hypothetical protein